MEYRKAGTNSGCLSYFGVHVHLVEVSVKRKLTVSHIVSIL